MRVTHLEVARLAVREPTDVDDLAAAVLEEILDGVLVDLIREVAHEDSVAPVGLGAQRLDLERLLLEAAAAGAAGTTGARGPGLGQVDLERATHQVLASLGHGGPAAGLLFLKQNIK